MEQVSAAGTSPAFQNRFHLQYLARNTNISIKKIKASIVLLKTLEYVMISLSFCLSISLLKETCGVLTVQEK